MISVHTKLRWKDASFTYCH